MRRLTGSGRHPTIQSSGRDRHRPARGDSQHGWRQRAAGGPSRQTPSRRRSAAKTSHPISRAARWSCKRGRKRRGMRCRARETTSGSGRRALWTRRGVTPSQAPSRTRLARSTKSTTNTVTSANTSRSTCSRAGAQAARTDSAHTAWKCTWGTGRPPPRRARGSARRAAETAVARRRTARARTGTAKPSATAAAAPPRRRFA
mmetsp:Transcript_17749/g.42906  ORF Transcript_17749/g.42906 Transcript_17749/m.42906 type:complete len:202 (+) Transcript_17749:330-935(+)